MIAPRPTPRNERNISGRDPGPIALLAAKPTGHTLDDLLDSILGLDQVADADPAVVAGAGPLVGGWETPPA